MEHVVADVIQGDIDFVPGDLEPGARGLGPR